MPPTAAAPTAPRREIDATGLSCPMPVIELAKGVEQLAPGQQLVLLATDPAARVDVPVWCRMKRQRLVEATDHDGTYRFVVERTS
ncbi:MAG: sulfurtransferase TusA family protein [Nitriliruptoraceae bacterium]